MAAPSPPPPAIPASLQPFHHFSYIYNISYFFTVIFSDFSLPSALFSSDQLVPPNICFFTVCVTTLPSFNLHWITQLTWRSLHLIWWTLETSRFCLRRNWRWTILPWVGRPVRTFPSQLDDHIFCWLQYRVNPTGLLRITDTRHHIRRRFPAVG